MLERNRVLKIVLIIFWGLSFFKLSTYNLEAYNCTDLGLYCQAPNWGGINNIWSKNDDGHPGIFVCELNNIAYPCYGNNTNCTGGANYYATYSDCVTNSNSLFKGCCGSTPTCTPGCTPPSCPSGTSTSGTGSLYTPKPSCTDDCGDNHTRNCYYNCAVVCEDINPELYTTCPSGQTCDLLDITYQATPECGGDMETTQCYHPRNAPPDTNLDLMIYYGNHKGEIQSSNIVERSPLLSKIIRRVNAQVQDPEADIEYILNYTSQTYSGTQLNNPVKILAQFQDTDGTEDIVATYVWWSLEDGEFTTPNRIADPAEGLTPQSETEGYWGIMVRRISGTWSKVYAPYISETDSAWVEIGDVGGAIDPILSSDNNPMVGIYSLSVTDIPAEDKVQVEFLMNFLDDQGGNQSPSEGEYYVRALANDVDGFLPFEAYPEIEDYITNYNYWTEDAVNWNLDLTNPNVIEPTLSINLEEEEPKVNIQSSVSDNIGPLSWVRVDACRSGGITNEPITSSGSPIPTVNPYIMSSCSAFDITDITDNNSNYLYLAQDVPSGSAITLNVNPQDNTGGSITFRVIAMDLAGNYTYQDSTFTLGDWVVTKNGLVYGASGVSSETRDLEETVWDSLTLALKEQPYGFTALKADLSEIALLGGNSSTVEFLGSLAKYNENTSVKVARHPGVNISSPYTELMGAYNSRKGSMDLQEVVSTDTLTGNLIGDICDGTKDICSISSSADLNIPNTFTCNGNGVIFVDGDINISPDSTGGNLNACIFLSSGSINILEGSDKSGVSTQYDILHGYYIANDQINIEADSNGDALLVEGGLLAFGDQNRNIVNNRELSWNDRDVYPILAIKGNSKYGLLSQTIFGSQIDVFKVEVGFKPY